MKSIALFAVSFWGFMWSFMARTGYVLSVFITVLAVCWAALAFGDFGYSFWYRVLAIDENIEAYGPRNHYRKGFHHTTDTERKRLFSAINRSIHDNGLGLTSLRYRNVQGRVLGVLLTPPEIVHLQDVAALVRKGVIVSVTAGIIFCGFMVMTIKGRWQPPSLGRSVLLLLVPLLISVVLIAVTGPVRVFYGLHQLLFPADHPWFFYYEDSLMTTMMKAPDLFLAIAALWLTMACLLTPIVFMLMARLNPPPKEQ